jgi:hypothetical protein
LSLDTRPLSDGAHSVQVAASDAAGNEGRSSSFPITVDNTAPAAPQGLGVVGGDFWRSTNSFSVSWSNPPGQVSPVVAAHYAVCTPDGLSCQPTRDVSGNDVSRLDGISVPSTGEWSLRVWLEDAAGNVDSTRSSTATLRYGSAPTHAATPPSPDASATGSGSSQPTSATPPGTEAALLAPTPGATVSAPLLLSPRLRVTSARYVHGRLVLRGSSAAPGRAVLTLRVGHRRVTRSVRLPGGSFRLAIRVARPARRASLALRQTALLHAQTVVVRVR